MYETINYEKLNHYEIYNKYVRKHKGQLLIHRLIRLGSNFFRYKIDNLTHFFS